MHLENLGIFTREAGDRYAKQTQQIADETLMKSRRLRSAVVVVVEGC